MKKIENEEKKIFCFYFEENEGFIFFSIIQIKNDEEYVNKKNLLKK